MRRSRSPLLLSGALAASALVSAASAQGAVGPADEKPAEEQAGSNKMEHNHTQVLFSVSHMGFTEYSGRFSGADGSLQINPNHLAATRLDVSVPVSSVSTTSQKLDGELKSAQWLDAGQFADMRFRSTRVTPTGAGHARSEGELTLHGVTRPMVLHARFIGAGVDPLSKAYTVGFEGTGELSRSAYGVKTYVPLIGDEVHLTIAGAFTKTS